jgi:hypothetical protein
MHLLETQLLPIVAAPIIIMDIITDITETATTEEVFRMGVNQDVVTG